MEKSNQVEQMKEFAALWHELLKLEQNSHMDSEYSNFVALSVNEISVIDIVAKNPNVILKDISTMLELPKSTLTNMINRLERKGYLNRTISKQDLRSYGLELTQKGELAQKEHREYEAFIFGKIMDALTEEDRSHLLSILKKIANAF